MNSNQWVQLEQFTTRRTTADKPQGSTHDPAALIGPVRQAILCARQCLFTAQQDDGQWVTRVGLDTAHASQLLLACEILENKDHDRQFTEELVHALVEQSLPRGGWSRTHDTTLDVSVSVLAYLALKTQGTDPTSPVMRAARSAILAAGGADRCNTTTRYWLALLGQISFEDCPPFPPEMVFLSPRLTTATSGDLATATELNAALSILWAHRPVYKVKPKRGVRELFVDAPASWPPPRAVETPQTKRRTGGWWHAAFDRATQWLEHRGWVPLRRRALLRLEKRLLKPSQATESAASGIRQTIWSQIALLTRGHRYEANELPSGSGQENPLLPIPRDGYTINSCPPGLIDTRTADVLMALVESGLSPHDGAVFAATDIFIDQVKKALESPEQVEATTLASLLAALAVLQSEEQNYTNELPPHLWIHDEVDDPTSYCQWGSPAGLDTAQALAAGVVNALVDCQHRDGSWTPTPELRTGSDKPCSRVAATGAVVVALSRWGLAHDDPSIRQASTFLRQTQVANGSWNNAAEEPSIHATSLAMRGLLAAGTTADHETIAAGVNWLLTQQTPDGGWGEFPLSNDPGSVEPTSVVQSVDALLALLAADEHASNQVLQGIHFLLEQQRPDGSWPDLFFRPGSPVAFRGEARDLAATANPLQALAHWAVAFGQQADQDEPPRLQLMGAMPATDADW